MTQISDVHRFKSSFASSFVFVSESATTQLSLSHLCARHFTRNDSNIAYCLSAYLLFSLVYTCTW